MDNIGKWFLFSRKKTHGGARPPDVHRSPLYLIFGLGGLLSRRRRTFVQWPHYRSRFLFCPDPTTTRFVSTFADTVKKKPPSRNLSFEIHNIFLLKLDPAVHRRGRRRLRCACWWRTSIMERYYVSMDASCADDQNLKIVRCSTFQGR